MDIVDVWMPTMAPLQMHSSPFELSSSSGDKRYFGGRRDHFERIEPSRKEPEGGGGDVAAMKRGRRPPSHDYEYSSNYAETPQRTLVEEPHENDVCLGRGGTANKHTGNEKLRQFARLQSENYRSSTKKGKSMISRSLVKQMHELDPPSRFLKKDTETGMWEEVGDDTAREKASQVLRDAVAILLEAEEQGAAASQVPGVAAAVMQVPPSVASSQVPAVAMSQAAAAAAAVPPVPADLGSIAGLSSQEVTLPIPELAASSVRQSHPGSPSSRSKRRRYSAGPASSQPTSPAAASMDVQQQHSSQFVARSPSLMRQQQQPGVQPFHHQRRSRSATSHHASPGRGRSLLPHDASAMRYSHSADSSPVRRGSVGAGSLGSGVPANMNEFDLFHGELLESDPEDNDDPLPLGDPRGDLF